MTRWKALVCSVAVASMAACNGTEEPEPTSCSNDWECAAGEVCNTTDGLCAAAADDTPRNFGQVEMTFDTGDEAYLLAVYDIPTDAETSSNLLTFSLSAGGTPAGALRIRPAVRAPSYEPNQSEWDARIAFENRRREGIDRLIDDVRAGKRSLHGVSTRQVACTTSSECELEGANHLCWQGECTDTPVLKMLATGADTPFTSVAVVGTGLELNVLLDNDDNTGGAGNAAEMAAAEVVAALELEHQLYGLQGGHTGGLDRDGDGRVTVAFTSKMPPGIVGAFDYPDYLPAADGEASGNEADILWAGVPTLTSMNDPSCPAACGDVTTQELSVGTLVHEYTHLIQFATRVYDAGAMPEDNEVLWLDEAMAHLMEDMAGYGASNVGSTAVALDEWPSFGFASGEDSLEQRGRGYLLLRYIVDRQSGAATATAANNYGLHGMLVGESELGYLHSPFQSLGADGVWDWLLATYATNNPDVTESAAQGKPYLPPGTVSATGQTTGFDPFGSFTDARGVSVDLTGPALGDGSTDEIDDLTDPFESEVQASGAVLYIVTGLDAGTAVVVGTGDAQNDLHVRAQRVY